MKSERLIYSLGQVDDKYITEASPSERIIKNSIWIKRFSVAACFILVITIGILRLNVSNTPKRASFKTVESVPGNISSAKNSLVWHSEEELFSVWRTVIFKGTVTGIQNIEIDFNGDKEYRSIAEIEVEKVYRGNIKLGDNLSVLLPCPISINLKVEDTDIISQIKVGTTGIFMPMEYNESSIWEQKGAVLMLKDVADYGFADGRRYAFLETDTGLIFARDAYPSIEAATTLQEVENFVLKMIN
ncbi:hypothetical protein [Acetivibrio clariflavus]|uniref:Uncharacterized protein n=1 Tax=Acetivibrio clariflavus (strain DSM 19732 / NBRC 101661 / EBR45) TaxID=720554 RepID=G8LUV9_ACECE|nr:hypothetical protein [Acetivibrio clariflavus]AEV68489.1 hypothetical protein Clocl_1882 [Acetivibrio clariflavus DSM 19732]